MNKRGKITILSFVLLILISVLMMNLVAPSNGGSTEGNNYYLDDASETLNLNSDDKSSGITGAVIGTDKITGGHLVIITGIIAGLFIALIICQTIIKIKSFSKKLN